MFVYNTYTPYLLNQKIQKALTNIDDIEKIPTGQKVVGKQKIKKMRDVLQTSKTQIDFECASCQITDDLMNIFQELHIVNNSKSIM